MEKRYGLIGRTLGHSYSVPIHHALGCQAYTLYPMEPDQLEGFLNDPLLGGVNVTIPYKIAAMELCDVLSPTAKAIGSVNTIVRRTDGSLYGENTDAVGFRAMAASAGISIRGKKLLVLGSGGASLMVQAVAAEEGASSVVVISRSGSETYETLHRHTDAELIVNATPVGMYPSCDQSPVDLSRFPHCCGVLDLVYNPLRTRLLQQAEQLNIPHAGGLLMLVAQAVAAEEIFFDRAFPADTVEKVFRVLRSETENIVLIGMPGCGKTTVGEALSRLSGRKAIDLDAELEARMGMTIPMMFQQQGESAFRAQELKLAGELGKEHGLILMTGGGIVTQEQAYAPLHQNGRLYELYRDLELLPTEGRPISQTHSLKELAQQRAPLYAKFRDVRIENLAAPEDAAEQIWNDFCNC